MVSFCDSRGLSRAWEATKRRRTVGDGFEGSLELEGKFLHGKG
jgi:hypothetical protein